MRALIAALMMLTSTNAAPVQRVILIPASQVVDTRTCEIQAVQRHVTFRLRPTEGSPTFFQLTAHTNSTHYVWRVHHKPGPGWARVTRRLAIATVNCGV